MAVGVLHVCLWMCMLLVTTYAISQFLRLQPARGLPAFANAAPVGPNAGRYNLAGSFCGPRRTGAGPISEKTLMEHVPACPTTDPVMGNMTPPMGQMGPLMGKMSSSLLVIWLVHMHAFRWGLQWCAGQRWCGASGRMSHLYIDQRLLHLRFGQASGGRIPGQPLSGRA